MILSMTGFSKSEMSSEGIKISVEIKTINSRGLDINVRTPKSLSDKEYEIREKVKNKVGRGNVNVYVTMESDSTISNFNINDDIALGIKKELEKFKKKAKIKESVKFDHILKFSDYFLQEERVSNPDLEWSLTANAIKQALDELIKNRKKEGSNIASDMKKRMSKIHGLIKKIEVEGVERIPHEREKIRQRVAQVFDNDEIDESRLQMEMVMMADKLDISEECVRMHSHIKLFYDTVKERKSNGRKLNFILQEMLRETNTIGSKCNSTTIGHKVVSVKEELEKIREQVQNVE